MTGLPSLRDEAGDDGVEGALARRDLVGWPGSSLKPEPRFCRLMPVPGTTTPEPKPMKFDWIIDTIMPLASAAAR